MKCIHRVSSRKFLLSHNLLFQNLSSLSQTDDTLKSIFKTFFIGAVHPSYVPPFPLIALSEKHKSIYPFHPLTEPTREDRIFAALRRVVLKPRAQEARKNAWISATTWRLVNKRVSTRRDITNDQYLIRRLGRAIREILRKDRKWWEEEVGEELEALLGLDPPLQQED